MRGKFRFSLAAIVFMAVGALVPTPAGAAGAPTPTFVAGGFDSPRGVEFFKGKLVVGEAGHGGKNCIPASAENPLTCFGRTSQISWVNTATKTHSTLVDHLFSVVEYHGPQGEALGVDGISARDGKLMAILGVFPQAFADYQCAPGDAECAADLDAAKEQAGALISVRANGSWRKVAGVGAFDFDWTADKAPQEHDANPYGVLAVNGGSYVVDAGSNTLNFVSNSGHITILHHFPWKNPQTPPAGFPTDEVPTCVVKADDGLWVATLSGHLFRVQGTSATLVPNPLLKHVTGCAADQEDNVYFVNMWTTPTFPTPFSGDIVKFNSGEGTSSIIAGGLNFPNMDVVGPDGNLYFSADSVCPAAGIQGFCPQGGTVWKLALLHGDNEGDSNNNNRHN
jgi:hypothetical protein